MMVKQDVQDIDTPTGTMRCYLYRPDAEGQFSTIIFYSEIFLPLKALSYFGDFLNVQIKSAAVQF